MPAVDLSPYLQPSGTGADGTKFDNALNYLQTILNGLDKNNLAAAAGILASQLADPTTGKVLGSSGGACAAVFPPGYELAYVEFTATVNVTAVTSGTANSVVSAGSVAYDGTPIIIEFFAMSLDKGTSQINVELYDGATSLGRFAAPQQAQGGPALFRRKITPTAGAHTFSAAAYVDAGTGHVFAGVGGASTNGPGYIRVTKA